MPRLNVSNVFDEEELETTRLDADTVLNDVNAQMKAMGLPDYPKPVGSPQTLSDIDVESLSNPDLGTLYTQYTAFAQYVYGQWAQAEASYKLASTNMKRLEARIKSSLLAKGMAASKVPSAVKENGVWLEAEFETVRLYVIKTILEAHYKAYDKQASALSRIIALRELEFEKAMRENGITNRRKKHLRPQDFRR